MDTTVINILKAPAGWETDSRYQYIGRIGKGLTSNYGNPIVRGKTCPVCRKIHYKPGETIHCFELYARDRIKYLGGYRTKIENLRGKILVCFCMPNPCHGEVYIKLLKEMEEGII